MLQLGNVGFDFGIRCVCIVTETKTNVAIAKSIGVIQLVTLNNVGSMSKLKILLSHKNNQIRNGTTRNQNRNH